MQKYFNFLSITFVSIKIFFLLIILNSYLVYSLDPIISGEYFTGDNITINNKTLFIIGTDSDGSYWNNYSAVIFQGNNVLFKVNKGKCKKIDYYEYCFEDSYYNWEKNFTWIGRVLEPSMIIKIYYYTPEIVFERNESIELEYNRPKVIDLRFKNNGNRETVVKYQEVLPYDFLISNCVDCTISINKINANIKLKAGEEKTIYYTITYLGYKNFSWNMNYTYTYDNNVIKEFKTITSSVKIPYELTESLSQSTSSTLGEISTYTVSVANLYETPLKVNISIMNEQVKDYYGLVKYENKIQENNNAQGNYQYSYVYKYDGLIGPLETKNFSISIESSKIGVFPIILDATIIANNNIFTHRSNKTYNVSLNPLVPFLITDKEVADPNDTISLIAYLKNTDEKQQYLYVYAHLLPLDNYWTFNSISPGKEILLYNDTFRIPDGDDDLYIILSGVYRTTNFQEQKFTLKKIIDIRGREPKTIHNSNAENNTQSNETSADQSIEQKNNITNEQYSDENSQLPQETPPGLSQNLEDTQNSKGKEKKEDFLEKIIKSIDSFIKRLFGKK
ncbi:MAG: hypothetical protein KatS3mg002_1117 [Candidatus Woesearchaeota archaeon]|nr:MAG: hypothetical protein KatS3mg002_1117 [Candidatus Woesearchaeota archaeon]